MKREITKNEAKEYTKLGYKFDDVLRGYIRDSKEDILNGAEYIKVIKEIDMFDSEKEAIEYVEKHDGIAILHSIPEEVSKEFKDCFFINTKNNIKKVKEYIKNKYGKDWVNEVSIVDREELIKKLIENKNKYEDTGRFETVLSDVKCALSFRDRDEETIYCTMGSAEYYLNDKIIRNLVHNLIKLKDEDKLTENDINFVA